MEQRIDKIQTLEQDLQASQRTNEDLRKEILVMENDAEVTLCIDHGKSTETLGHQLYEFLKEDPMKRIKFIRLLQDFDDFEYNYSKIENLDEIPENEQLFIDYFNPVINLYLDCDEEKTELKAIIEQL